jgi:hypothetical protein
VLKYRLGDLQASKGDTCYAKHNVQEKMMVMYSLCLQVCAEDRLYMEAFDHMLEAWISVLNDSQVFPKDFCKQSSMQIFNTYLKCHLSPPDGSRGQVVIMSCTLFFYIYGKAFPLQAWTGPWGSRRLRLQNF